MANKYPSSVYSAYPVAKEIDVIAGYINFMNHFNHFQKLNTNRCLTREKYLTSERVLTL